MKFIRFVREAFCWPAFILTSLWLIYNRLWAAALVWISSDIMIFYSVYSGLLPYAMSMMVKFALSLILGYVANDLLRENLNNRGFVMRSVVAGENELRAQQRFFDCNQLT